jgi:glycerol-3-phosphate dehydrogenase (NAD(P)+)
MSRDRVRAVVVGAGSWGTTLALLLHRNGHDVTLWSFEESVVEEVRTGRENRTYLPGVELPEGLGVTSDLPGALQEAELVVSVTPAQHVGSVMTGAASHFRDDVLVVSASKGIEIATLRTMDQVLAEALPPAAMERFSVLSGPSFALEVARELPTAVVVASPSREVRLRVQGLFASPTFRVYTNPDVVGVELGGAVKNVIALAAGVAAGLGAGHNTMAALITRGLAEIRRLGLAMGAHSETFAGLAGMGDLVLTCTGELSRNRTVGYRLGQGESLDTILADMTAVAEGVRTTPAVHALAGKHGVEMPIVAQVHGILEGRVRPADALSELMQRDPKPEDWG